MSHGAQDTQSSAFNLSAWAIKNRSPVIFLMLATLVAGFFSYANLSRNEDPPFTIKTMVVSAFWPGASTTDTTNLLTDKLEQKLEETPYLDRLDSYTKPGEAVVFVHLRDDMPPEKVADVWYDVRKKIQDITPTLPAGVVGPFFDDEFGDTFALIFGFTAEGFSPRELRDKLDEIRAELLKTKDIGKVNVLGVQEEQIVVEFSPSRLAAYGLDTNAVVAALQKQNAVAPAGVVNLPDEKVGIKVSGAFASEESLKSLTLAVNGRFVPLTDLVTIKRSTIDPPQPMFRVNGQPALGLAVSMSASGNLLEFGESVKAKMQEIGARLPWGIEQTVVADQSVVVEDAVSGFLTVLIEAIVIVLGVSFLSLGARAGLVVTLSIPLVLAMTFVGMDLAGIGLQRISLGALIIALGLLVDDAMITVEAMVSRLENGWDRSRAAGYAYETTAFPMLTGTLVMIAGFIPVGFAQSSAGEYTFSLFMVVLISLAASWIVAVLFSPLLGTWVLPATMKSHQHKQGAIGKGFSAALNRSLDKPVMVVAGAFICLFVALLGSAKLEEQFFPPSDRPELLVSLTLPQNASLAATDAQAQKLEALLADDPDIERFSTYVGAGAIRFYLPMDVLLTNDNITQTVVVAKSVEQRDAVKARLEQAFRSDFADIVTRVTPLEVGPPVGWPMKYRVTGPDNDKVREIAQSLANLIARDEAITDVNLTSGEPRKSIVVEVDQIAARAVGLSSEDIASSLAVVYAGMPVTAVRDGHRLIEVTLRAEAAARTELSTIANLQIAGPDGSSIPLRQVANVAYGVEDPIIWRRQREAIITVQADITAGTQPPTVADRLSDSIATFQASLPDGYRIAEGGAVEEAEKGNSSVFAVIPLMLGVIATLLMIQLRSFSRAFLAFMMAPFGLIGVVLAMLPTATPMGFVAQLGVIALAGMIIRNAIILIEEVEANRASGLSAREAIYDATIHRARPIVLTALAAILGMIPIAPQIFWGPMAYAIIGGLAVATIFTLTLLPAALLLLLKAEGHRASKVRPGSEPNAGAAA